MRSRARSIGYDLDRLVIRTAAWRGLGAGPNTLASEMAIEAAATAAGVDPIDFRLRHVTDPRLQGVLKAVQKLAGTPPKTPPGTGRGVGCGIYKGVSYGAVIADVGLRPDGTPFVLRLFCAHDCGRIVNADQVRAQCEGNMVWALGMVLSDRLSVNKGAISEVDFADAPIPDDHRRAADGDRADRNRHRPHRRGRDPDGRGPCRHCQWLCQPDRTAPNAIAIWRR